jgi:Zn-dependent protease
MELNPVQAIAIYALPVIFAITLHEAAHGFVARYFGDTTAWRLGRVSLNPLRHIDPVGTIIVPLAMLMLGRLLGGGIPLFGWAKPVPVNFGALRRPKADMLWVALAGPAANLAMALAWALIFKFALVAPHNFFSYPLGLMADAGLQINIWIMALNLLPIPPLDGGRIVTSLLPMRAAIRFASIERYGFIILLALIAMPGILHVDLLQAVLMPPVAASINFIGYLFQI